MKNLQNHISPSWRMLPVGGECVDNAFDRRPANFHCRRCRRRHLRFFAVDVVEKRLDFDLSSEVRDCKERIKAFITPIDS